MVQRRRPLALVTVSAVAALLLAATLGLSIFLSRGLAASSAQVDHTMLVEVAVTELVGTLFEAETGQRGYVLTGRAEYLEPYWRARAVAMSRLDRLRLLSAHNETRQALVADVARLTALKLGELQEVIDHRAHDGQDAALALVDTDRGLRTMEALQEKLDEMKTVEDTRLAARRERQQGYESLSLISLVITSVFLGVCAGLVAFWTRTAEARRHSAESESARLRAENDVLAERERTTQFQEQFIAIVGHDLRTPLSSVSMGLQMLGRSPASPQQATLDRMARSTARMSRMIDQLLDLTRSRLGGGITLVPVPMNLGKLVTHVADETRSAHPERPLLVEVTGDLDGKWDPDRLAQVVSNLVANAIAHGATAGAVSVTAKDQAHNVEIAVHNAGPAIPELLRRAIFDPFRRGAPEGETSRSAGLGLGLYITREIVLAHGGSIDFVSTDADGTTFRIVIPRVSKESLLMRN